MIHEKSVLNEMMSMRLLASLGLAALLLVSASASAQVAPNLLSASSYSILAGTQVTNTGTSSVSGDVGISPGAGAVGANHPGLTAAMVGGTIHDKDVPAQLAQADENAAYTQLDLLNACTVTYPGAFGELAGQSLVPGVYCATQFRLSSGTLTLVGLASDTWVFKSASDLIITGGASTGVISPSCDVWWRVVSTATLDANSSLIGNILADTSITLAAGASLSGKAFARTAEVTLSSNTIRACVACPTILLTPNPLPDAKVGVAYSQQITASPAGTYTFSVVSGTLSGTLTLSPGGLLSGTPTTPGTVTIRATDANGCYAEIRFWIEPAGCPTITLSPNPLPNGMVGVNYNQQITASPTGTYTFSVVSGTLTGTLALSSGGLLSGTPTTPGTVIIQAIDGRGCFAEIPFTVGVAVTAGIPTLPGWGLMIFSVLLGLVSIYFVRRASGT